MATSVAFESDPYAVFLVAVGVRDHEPRQDESQARPGQPTSNALDLVRHEITILLPTAVKADRKPVP